MIKKVILAYSGGLDTSVILHWIKEKYNCEVVAYCADVGQDEDMQDIEEKAKKTGASSCYVADLKQEFARNYVFPMLRSSALYEMRYLMGTSIARPLIAKKQVEIAKAEKADAVAHGATGKGNDQVRFEYTYMTLAPQIKIIAPWREWPFKGRSDLISYAKEKNIPINITPEKPYSIDANLFHTSYEGGVLEDPYYEPKENMFLMTRSPEEAPDQPEYIEITFEKGNPVAINNQTMSETALIKKLNQLGGAHGIGRIDLVENRLVGIKSRGVYETPGGTLLYQAHQDLESIVLERDIQHLKDELSLRYGRLVYNGKWFSCEREALQTLIDQTQEYVSGTVRMKLYKGSSTIVGRKSPYSIYNQELASFEANDLYDQHDAQGFIRLFSLSSKVAYQNQSGKKPGKK